MRTRLPLPELCALCSSHAAAARGAGALCAAAREPCALPLGVARAATRPEPEPEGEPEAAPEAALGEGRGSLRALHPDAVLPAHAAPVARAAQPAERAPPHSDTDTDSGCLVVRIRFTRIEYQLQCPFGLRAERLGDGAESGAARAAARGPRVPAPVADTASRPKSVCLCHTHTPDLLYSYLVCVFRQPFQVNFYSRSVLLLNT